MRCFSCGKVSSADDPSSEEFVTDSGWVQVIGDLWERYLKLLDDGVTDG